MKTAVVNFKTRPDLKKRVLEKTKKAGIPLSFFLNQRMYEIDQAENIRVDFGPEEPSEWLIQQLKASAEDEKAGRISPTFDNADDAIAWLRDKNRKYANQIQSKV